MAKKSALTFGIIFLIAGIWGFFSSSILGLLAADTVSSVIHLIVGIILVAVALKAAAKSAVTLKTVGIIYILFAIVGFVQGTTVLGIFATDMTSSWIYLVLGIIMAALGWSDKKGSSAPSMPSSAPQA